MPRTPTFPWVSFTYSAAGATNRTVPASAVTCGSAGAGDSAVLPLKLSLLPRSRRSCGSPDFGTRTAPACPENSMPSPLNSSGVVARKTKSSPSAVTTFVTPGASCVAVGAASPAPRG